MKKLLMSFVLVLIFTCASFGGMTSSLVLEGNCGVELAAYPDPGQAESTSGNLTLSSVPSGATILSATLYAHDWFRHGSATPSAAFAGTSLGTASAFASDDSSVEAYKWDVTSLVTGNSTYSASASGFKNNNFGLALVAVFTDPSLPYQRIVINDGAVHLYLNDTDTTTFSGFGVGSGTLWIYTEADNSISSGEEIKLNGSIVGGPIDDNLGPYASLFSIPVTTQAGTNTVDIVSKGDRFGWHLAILEGASPSVIPAPGAILLGSIGVGLVGWLRKRRTL